jgi:uncharacterized protein
LLLAWLTSGHEARGALAEVRDEAHFFSADAVSQANGSIREIKQRFKKDLLIETIRQAPESKKDEANSSDEKVKGRLFANWAIERARMEGVNGIYVLITHEPGHVEVVVGNQTQAVFSKDARHRLSQLLLTHFRQKEYDEGLLAAVKEVRSVLAGAPANRAAAAPPGNLNQPSPNRPAPAGRGAVGSGSLIRWVWIALAVFLGVWLLSAVMRALSASQQRPAGAGFGGGGPMGSPYGGNGGYGGYGMGGGGFFSSLMGGLFGAAAGSWLYDQFSGGHSPGGGYGPIGGPPTMGSSDRGDTDYTAEGGDFDQAEANEGADGGFSDDNSSWGSGGDFGGDGGGDFGGGGDGGSGGDF